MHFNQLKPFDGTSLTKMSNKVLFAERFCSDLLEKDQSSPSKSGPFSSDLHSQLGKRKEKSAVSKSHPFIHVLHDSSRSCNFQCDHAELA